jgi:hypothetical protein
MGRMKLHIDEKVVAESDFRTQSQRFALCGEGLAVGRDAGDAVSSEYGSAFNFSGGRIEKVIFDVADDALWTSNASSRRRWRAIEQITSRDQCLPSWSCSQYGRLTAQSVEVGAASA